MEAFPDSERRQERRFNRKGVVMNIHRVLGLKKIACNISAKSELGRFPITDYIFISKLSYTIFL
jgi:hypothetical protein